MAIEKFTIEYNMLSAPVSLLWNSIATPSGLSQWFADEVEQDNDTFHFIWNGEEEYATVVNSVPFNFIRFRWDNDKTEKTYFELRITTGEITSATTLVITDFADGDDEIQSAIELWNYQVETLRRILGCN